MGLDHSCEIHNAMNCRALEGVIQAGKRVGASDYHRPFGGRIFLANRILGRYKRSYTAVARMADRKTGFFTGPALPPGGAPGGSKQLISERKEQA